MAAFFTDETHPLLLALYEGDEFGITQWMPQTTLDEKHRFEIEHEPSKSTIPQHATALEFVMHLFGQDAPISNIQFSQWMKSLNTVLDYQDVVVDENSMRLSVKMMEHRRVTAEQAHTVLKALDQRMANWSANIFEWKKETYLGAVLRHLPAALPSLRNSQFMIRKMSMNTASLTTKDMEWTNTDGWTPWFAWYPIKINGARKFLETVERKRNMSAGTDMDYMYSYREASELMLGSSPAPLRRRFG